MFLKLGKKMEDQAWKLERAKNLAEAKILRDHNQEIEAARITGFQAAASVRNIIDTDITSIIFKKVDVSLNINFNYFYL